jgi:hypothetical protein
VSYEGLTGIDLGLHWGITWYQNDITIVSNYNHIPEDCFLHSHRRENLKSYTFLLLSTPYEHHCPARTVLGGLGFYPRSGDKVIRSLQTDTGIVTVLWLQSGHDGFFPRLFQFILHYPPNHLTICIVGTENNVKCTKNGPITHLADPFRTPPITVAARSKAWTVFARSNTGIVGFNPTRGMDISVRLFCLCVVLYVSSGHATGWSPDQGDLPTVYRNKKLKNRRRSNGS